jgi:hypothetical protein
MLKAPRKQIRGAYFMVDLSRERAVLRSNWEHLFNCANVVATGIGYKSTRGEKTGTVAIVCSVTQKLPAAKIAQRFQIPALLDGVPTDVIETGTIRALQDRTGRHRPAPGGGIQSCNPVPSTAAISHRIK